MQLQEQVASSTFFEKLQEEQQQQAAAEEISSNTSSTLSNGTYYASSFGEGVEQWRGLVSQYDWPVDQALTIMYRESHGLSVCNSSLSCGIFQVHYPSHWKRMLELWGSDDINLLLDPVHNVQIAYDIWYDSGGNFSAWDTCC